MNFKTELGTISKNVTIVYSDCAEITKVQLSGGRLTEIEIDPGKFCVQGIVYSCGSQLNNRNFEREVILDMETIRTTWFKKGNPRMLEVDCDENCLWFSLENQ